MKGLQDIGTFYKGFLYAGLMIVENEPYLIEYNVRMGDPECQAILPKLNSDLLDLFIACCNENLDEKKIEWQNKKSMCIVLCSKGYPDDFKKNTLIKNIHEISLEKNEYCYHAGTKKVDEKIYAVGGRVLNFVCVSEDFSKSRDQIFGLINSLNWDNGFFRKDIGYKVIN